MTEDELNQERAEFEAAFIAEKIRIAGAQFTEEMARAFFLQMKDGEYVGLADQQAWWAWQASAARRAQVVPQAVIEAARQVHRLVRAHTFDMQHGVQSKPAWEGCTKDAVRVLQYLVDTAAAPQPPEAACNPSMQPLIESRDVVSAGSGVTVTRCNLSDAGRAALQSKADHIPNDGEMVAAPVQLPDALLTIETDAHYIFNNPPGECPQAVRDVIEWYAASVRKLLEDRGIK